MKRIITITWALAIVAVLSTRLMAQEPVTDPIPQPPVIDPVIDPVPQPPVIDPVPQPPVTGPQLTPEQIQRRAEIQEQLRADIWSRLEARGVDVVELRDRLNDDSPQAEQIRMRMRQSNVPVDMLREQLNESFLIRSRFGLLKSSIRHMQREHAEELEELGYDPNQPRGFGKGLLGKTPEQGEQGRQWDGTHERDLAGEGHGRGPLINRNENALRNATIGDRIGSAGLHRKEIGNPADRKMNHTENVGRLIEKLKVDKELRIQGRERVGNLNRGNAR